jgi:hypothetical protein
MASKTKPHDITIFATMKNSTALQLALAFEAKGRGFPRYVLVSQTILQHASKTDAEHYQRLSDKGLIWDPKVISGLNTDRERKAKARRIINGTWILISTVKLLTLLSNLLVWDA